MFYSLIIFCGFLEAFGFYRLIMLKYIVTTSLQIPICTCLDLHVLPSKIIFRPTESMVCLKNYWANLYLISYVTFVDQEPRNCKFHAHPSKRS